jgi:hypothetical protein
MAAKLTPAQLRARAVAYEEAADHLELNWTEDPLEREEGDRLTTCFRLNASGSEQWRALANSMTRGYCLFDHGKMKGKGVLTHLIVQKWEVSSTT